VSWHLISQVRLKSDNDSVVIPVKTGIQKVLKSKEAWMPPMEEWLIFHGAGMTNKTWNPDNKLLKETLA